MKLLRYSLDLFTSLEAETGQAVDFHRCGSVRLAKSHDRLDEFHYRKGIAEMLGGIVGAAHLPTDGWVDPTDLTQALAKGDRSKGAQILRHTAVTAIERSGRSWLVKASKGEIRADLVVNAAGQWARQIGHMVGVELPIVPLEHHYLVTEPVEELRSLDVELPVPS